MAVCKVCGKDIPKGERYKSETYQCYYFCSKECYENYVAQRQTPEVKQYNALKDYIDSIWGDDANWSWLVKQIEQMHKQYDLTYGEIFLVMKYAIEYENYEVNTDYGLAQFIRFIEPEKHFEEQINRAKEKAKDLPEEEVIIIKPHKRIRHRKVEEWD